MAEQLFDELPIQRDGDIQQGYGSHDINLAEWVLSLMQEEFSRVIAIELLTKHQIVDGHSKSVIDDIIRSVLTRIGKFLHQESYRAFLEGDVTFRNESTCKIDF